MRTVKGLALLVPFVALLACGGSVVSLGPGDGGPQGDGNPNPSCPAASGITNGVSCFDPGESCPGAYGQPQCSGPEIPVQCTCEGGAWQCPILSGGIACPPPFTPCPVPSAVVDGSYCSTDPSLSCQSDIPIASCTGAPYGYERCSCLNSAWNCPPEPGSPLCPVDAGTPCPDPNSVFAGNGCATYGTTCGGDPQTCGSGIVYDALQCSGGVWEIVAGTACDVDGGFVDAGGPDAGI